MRRILLYTVLAIAVVGSIGLIASPGAAQPNETAEQNETIGSQTLVEVDEFVRLTEWTYDEDAEVFELHFEVDRRSVITVSEAIQRPEGAGEGQIRQQRLSPGENVVTIPSRSAAGEAGVTMTTRQSIDEGRFVYVSTGVAQTGGPFEGTTATAGWFGGASVVFAMLLASAWQVKRKKLNKPEELT